MTAWAFELLDRLSGPAKAQASALDTLQSSLKATDRAMADLNRRATELRLRRDALGDTHQRERRQALAFERLQLFQRRSALATQLQNAPAAAEGPRGLLRTLGQALSPTRALRHANDQLSKSLVDAAKNGGLFRAALSGAGTVLAGLATGAVAAGVGVVALGASFARSALAAASFGRETREALQASLGAVEGGRQFQILKEFSARFGVDIRETTHQFNQLARYFNQNETMSLLQAAGDMAARNGPQAAHSAVKAISDIMSKGRLQMEELQGQLGEAGINVDRVIYEMAHARGVTTDRMRQLISGGKVGGREAVAAIARTIQRDFSGGGPFGTAMDRHAHSLLGTLDRITARWELFKVSLGEGSAFEPVQRFLGRVADMMDGNTESGRRFQSVLDNLFTNLFAGLDRQDPVKLFQDLVGAVTTVAAAMQTLAGWVIKVHDSWVELRRLMGAGDERNSAPGARAATSAARPSLRAEAGDARPAWQRLLFGPSAQENAVVDANWRATHGTGAGGTLLRAVLAPQTLFGGGGVPPTGAGTTARQLAAGGRNVSIGDVNVTVQADGAALSSQPGEAIGQQVGDAVHERVSSLLYSSAESQGHGT